MSPGESVNLSDLQMQLSVSVLGLTTDSQQEQDKVTPMTEENKQSKFFITTTFKRQSP